MSTRLQQLNKTVIKYCVLIHCVLFGNKIKYFIHVANGKPNPK